MRKFAVTGGSESERLGVQGGYVSKSAVGRPEGCFGENHRWICLNFIIFIPDRQGLTLQVLNIEERRSSYKYRCHKVGLTYRK